VSEPRKRILDPGSGRGRPSIRQLIEELKDRRATLRKRHHDIQDGDEQMFLHGRIEYCNREIRKLEAML